MGPAINHVHVFCHRNTAVIYAKPKASRVTKIFWNQVTFILREENLTHHIQNQTVIIKITKKEITSGHDVNLRLYLMIVFTSRNHHLSIFSRIISHLNNRNDGCVLWKHWILYLTVIAFIYLCSASSTWNFEMNEMKFVGRSSIYMNKIRTWKIEDGLSDREIRVIHLKTDFPRKEKLFKRADQQFVFLNFSHRLRFP